jgi:heparosan-N-sulfate-glucuronate 5-epimerase
MAITRRLNYYRRIFSAYLTPRKSQLTFWHDIPAVNPNSSVEELGEYYMPFTGKADYSGEYDRDSIPMLNYHGTVGLQYNPIAIAQYGLGNYNLYCRTEAPERKERFLNAANWLVEHMEETRHGTYVWNHHFDWEYRTLLKGPWYSGLAQGQGISLLIRAHKDTSDPKYLESAEKALVALQRDVQKGGAAIRDDHGYLWLEESIVEPPTHILNGFMWASWGIYDYYLHTKNQDALLLFNDSVRTLRDHLHLYDTGFWSLYEQSGTRMKMLASPFYHALHIVQLQVMHAMTGDTIFAEFAQRWSKYRQHWLKRKWALAYKAVFKLLYY